MATIEGMPARTSLDAEFRVVRLVATHCNARSSVAGEFIQICHISASVRGKGGRGSRRCEDNEVWKMHCGKIERS